MPSLMANRSFHTIIWKFTFRFSLLIRFDSFRLIVLRSFVCSLILFGSFCRSQCIPRNCFPVNSPKAPSISGRVVHRQRLFLLIFRRYSKHSLSPAILCFVVVFFTSSWWRWWWRWVTIGGSVLYASLCMLLCQQKSLFSLTLPIGLV